MKIGQYWSLISIVITAVFFLLKVQFDFTTYYTMKETMANSGGDISPSLVAGSLKVVLLFIFPLILSLVLGIIGLRKKNNYRKIALSFNILTIIFLLIPAGILIAVM